MKRGILLLFLLILLEVVSAEIIIDNFEGIYNIGDNLNLSFSIQKQKSVSDYVECYLDCGERVLVHKKYYRLEKDQKRKFEIEFPASLLGNCYVEVFFDKEREESSGFEISNNINLEISINNRFFFPNEKILINGTAKKASGERLKGIVEISFGNLENKSVEVKGGDFFVDFKVKEDMLPGEYEVEIQAIEKNVDEEVINRGIKKEKIEVKSTPTYLEIISENSVLPSDFSAKINLLDQALNLVSNETVIVKLFDPEGTEIVSKSVNSGGDFSYFFPDNSSRGFWQIKAYYGNIFYAKPVNIEDNKKIDFNIVNVAGKTYLEIVNVGNVIYEGNFEMNAEGPSSKNIFVNVSLDIGDKELYLLNDQLEEGNYTLTVEGNRFPVLITGMAISDALRIRPISYAFFFLFILAAAIVYFTAGKVRKLKLFPSKKKQENKAYMIFLKFDKFPEEINEIVERENLSLSRVSENLCYVLFYKSHQSNPEFLAYNLAKKIRNKSFSLGREVGIVINSGSFYDKEKFLKSFSFNTRKMVEHSRGGILISQDIFDTLKIKATKSLKFTHERATFKMFRI